MWLLQHKPFRPQTHQPWVQTYKDPTPRIIEQASEGSAFPNGLVIVSCDTCQETALPIPDAAGYAQSWRHACAEELEAAAEAALDLEHVREGCTRSVILFVSELFAYPELLVQVVDVLEEHSFAHVLDMIQDDAKDNDLADLALLLPAGVDWDEESAQAPPVLVAPGSSRRWVAVNAVGLAHALVAGRHEQLESCRRPDIQALRSWVDVVSNAKYDIPALECVLHLQGCDYVRLMGKSSKQATHRCTVAGPDEATEVKSFGHMLHSTDDLPTPYRLALLASLFFGDNPAGVQPSTFTWVGDGPEPEKQRTRTDRKGGAEKRRFKPAIPVSGSKREAALSKRPYKSNVEIQQMLAGLDTWDLSKTAQVLDARTGLPTTAHAGGSGTASTTTTTTSTPARRTGVKASKLLGAVRATLSAGASGLPSSTSSAARTTASDAPKSPVSRRASTPPTPLRSISRSASPLYHSTPDDKKDEESVDTDAKEPGGKGNWSKKRKAVSPSPDNARSRKRRD